MFEEIWDRLSFLGSFRWPAVTGYVTVAEIEENSPNTSSPRLSVTYEFSVGEDGPYAGECFWEPNFTLNKEAALRAAEQKISIKQPIEIRYRPGDPSVNTGTKGLRELLR